MDAMTVYVSEFIGTAVLLAFGTSTNASMFLKGTLAGAIKSNWVGLLLGWGFGVAFAVYTGLTLGGPAHLNPALTLSFALGGMFDWSIVPGTILAQMLGGFVGAGITALHYYPHFKVTGPDEGNMVGIFATGPASDNRIFNLLSEIVATFMFVFAVMMLGKMGEGLAPLVIGFLVVSIGMSFGSTTGFALNPARDFGPRLAYTILPIPNRGTANWGYWWVPVFGPIIGAVLAVFFTNGVLRLLAH